MFQMGGKRFVASRTVMDAHPEFYLGMGMTAENVAHDFKISRDDQDRFSVESHQKAVKAIESGWFKNEIAPVQVTFRTPGKDAQAKVETKVFDTDEGPRGDTTIDALGKLKAAFLQGGTVTAGNSSQMSDGAAMCLVVSERFAKQHNLQPVARFCGYAVAGVPPRIMGIGPVAAIPKALARAGIKQSQIQRIELNEAFAAQVLSCLKGLGVARDDKRVNPNGGAIAVGVIAFAFAKTKTTSFLGGAMRLPTANQIDRRLIAGALMFGAGWGLAGFCPGPALVSLAAGQPKAAVFVVFMVAGMMIFELLERRSQQTRPG